MDSRSVDEAVYQQLIASVSKRAELNFFIKVDSVYLKSRKLVSRRYIYILWFHWISLLQVSFQLVTTGVTSQHLGSNYDYFAEPQILWKMFLFCSTLSSCSIATFFYFTANYSPAKIVNFIRVLKPVLDYSRGSRLDPSLAGLRLYCTKFYLITKIFSVFATSTAFC